MIWLIFQIVFRRAHFIVFKQPPTEGDSITVGDLKAIFYQSNVQS
jgi:hypothetical protein